jgi:uncharacterized protein (TIGR02246 family)
MDLRALVLPAVVCVLAGHALAQDKATIQKLNDQLEEAYNSGNPGSVAAMYTEDAILLPPGHPVVRGRQAIAAYMKDTMEKLGNLELTTVDVKNLASDAGREIGTFTARTKGEDPQELTGKYLIVWQKAGAAWKIEADIWNTDK